MSRYLVIASMCLVLALGFRGGLTDAERSTFATRALNNVPMPARTTGDLYKLNSASITADVLGEKAGDLCRSINGFSLDETNTLKQLHQLTIFLALNKQCDKGQFDDAKKEILDLFVADPNAFDQETNKDLIQTYTELYAIGAGNKKFNTAFEKAFQEKIFPLVKSDLKVTGEKKVAEYSSSSALVIDLLWGLGKSQYSKLISGGAQTLIDNIVTVSEDQASFVSARSGENGILMNYRMLQALNAAAPDTLKKNAEKLHLLQSYTLSKIGAINCECSAYKILQTLVILNDLIPAVSVDLSNLKEVTVSPTHSLTTESFKTKSVSAEIELNGKTTEVKFTSGKNGFVAKSEFPNKPGKAEVTFTVQAGKEKFTFPASYFNGVSGDAKVKSFSTPYAKVELSLGKKKQADHAYIEIRHKTKTDVVFYKTPDNFSNGVFSFTNVKLDTKTQVTGDYIVTFVAVDSTLSTDIRTPVGFLSAKKGRDEKKSDVHKDYTVEPEIEHIFREKENVSKDPLIPLIFSIVPGVITFIFFVVLSTKGNLKNFGSVNSLVFFGSVVATGLFFFAFWTGLINIVQGVVYGSPALFFSSCIVVRALKGTDLEDKKKKD